MKGRESDAGDRPRPGCNVNSTFNFIIGALAIVAALVIGYFAVKWIK